MPRGLIKFFFKKTGIELSKFFHSSQQNCGIEIDTEIINFLKPRGSIKNFIIFLTNLFFTKWNFYPATCNILRYLRGIAPKREYKFYHRKVNKLFSGQERRKELFPSLFVFKVTSPNDSWRHFGRVLYCLVHCVKNYSTTVIYFERSLSKKNLQFL